MFDTYVEELNYKYFEDFKLFWYPIYRKQIFKLKYFNDTEGLIEIKDNINKNIHLQDYKYIVFKDLGIRCIKC